MLLAYRDVCVVDSVQCQPAACIRQCVVTLKGMVGLGGVPVWDKGGGCLEVQFEVSCVVM